MIRKLLENMDTMREPSERDLTDAMGYFDDFAEEAIQQNSSQVYDMKSGTLDPEDYQAMRHDLIGDVVGAIKNGLENYSMGYFDADEIQDWAENWVDNYLENESLDESHEDMPEQKPSRLREIANKYKSEAKTSGPSSDVIDRLSEMKKLSGQKK